MFRPYSRPRFRWPLPPWRRVVPGVRPGGGAREVSRCGYRCPPEWFDIDIRPSGEQLGTPSEAGGPNAGPFRECLEVVAVGRNEDIFGRCPFGNAGDSQLLGLFGRHVLHRMNRPVEFVLKEFLIKRADKGTGLPEPMDEFVSELIAASFDFDELDLVSAILEGLLDDCRLSLGEVGSPRRQP